MLGSQGVEGVRIRPAGADGGPREIDCAGFFAYVGLAPACDFAPPAILRDAAGFLVTDGGLQTALPGLYAAGAVRSGYGGMLTHAIAEGIKAASSAKSAIGA